MTTKTKSPAGPIADLYTAACKIVEGTRKVFTEHGKDARELRLPILMHGTDMRVTIEAGPKIAARNAIEHAQMEASGKPVEPTTYVDVTAPYEKKQAMLAAHASQREWLRAHHGMDEYVEIKYLCLGDIQR